MRKTVLAVAVLIVASAFAQEVEHAPTVAQYQADRAYWMSKLEKPDGHGADDVSYDTLRGWSNEMDKCEVVDPANYPKYYNAWVEAVETQEAREVSFIVRHNLWKQFMAEDAAGKR